MDDADLAAPADTAALIAAATTLAQAGLHGRADAARERLVGLYRDWILRRRGMTETRAVWADRATVLLHLMAGASTIGEAIDILVRFGGTVWGSEAHFALDRRAGGAAMTFAVPERDGADGAILALWPLAITLSQLDFLAGAPLAGIVGHVPGEAVLPPAVAALLFRAPIVHATGETALLLPSNELDRGIAVRAADVAGFMRGLVAASIGAGGAAPGSAVRVANLLWAAVQRDGSGRDTMAMVARSLGLSVATLRRRLTREATTFQRIRQKVRNDAAKLWLQEGTHPVERIAERLGYSDAHSFRRAFRRANGMPPLVYRRQAQSSTSRDAPVAAHRQGDAWCEEGDGGIVDRDALTPTPGR